MSHTSIPSEYWREVREEYERMYGKNDKKADYVFELWQEMTSTGDRAIWNDFEIAKEKLTTNELEQFKRKRLFYLDRSQSYIRNLTDTSMKQMQDELERERLQRKT